MQEGNKRNYCSYRSLKPNQPIAMAAFFHARNLEHLCLKQHHLGLSDHFTCRHQHACGSGTYRARRPGSRVQGSAQPRDATDLPERSPSLRDKAQQRAAQVRSGLGKSRTRRGTNSPGLGATQSGSGAGSTTRSLAGPASLPTQPGCLST